MISAMGVRYPGRVVGARRNLSGIRRPRCAGRGHRRRRLQRRLPAHRDGHDDQLLSIEEVIRGHLGTIKFVSKAASSKSSTTIPDQMAGGPAKPETTAKPDETIRSTGDADP